MYEMKWIKLSFNVCRNITNLHFSLLVSHICVSRNECRDNWFSHFELIGTKKKRLRWHQNLIMFQKSFCWFCYEMKRIKLCDLSLITCPNDQKQNKFSNFSFLVCSLIFRSTKLITAFDIRQIDNAVNSQNVSVDVCFSSFPLKT